MDSERFLEMSFPFYLMASTEFLPFSSPLAPLTTDSEHDYQGPAVVVAVP